MPEDWPIDGTTGYDFLNRVLRLFIDPQGEVPLTEFYAEFTGEPIDYAALERDKKQLVIRDLFASDLNRLTAQLADISESRRRFRDYTRREMNQMLREALANLDVYRTYVQAEDGHISDVDRRLHQRCHRCGQSQSARSRWRTVRFVPQNFAPGNARRGGNGIGHAVPAIAAAR